MKDDRRVVRWKCTYCGKWNYRVLKYGYLIIDDTCEFENCGRNIHEPIPEDYSVCEMEGNDD